MSERLSDLSATALTAAGMFAQRGNCGSLDTHHLLLALANCSGPAMKVLFPKLKEISQSIPQTRDSKVIPSPEKSPPKTMKFQMVIETATRIADNDHDILADPGHLLRAIIQVKENKATEILERVGFDLPTLAKKTRLCQVVQMFASGNPEQYIHPHYLEENLKELAQAIATCVGLTDDVSEIYKQLKERPQFLSNVFDRLLKPLWNPLPSEPV